MVEAMEMQKGYKQTDVGVIPGDWDVKRLAEIGESIIGLTYSPSNVREYGTLVLRSSNVQNGKLAFYNNVYVDMELPKRVIVEEGDILICVRNGSRQLIGKCARIDKKIAGSAFGAFMSIYRSKYSDFIFHQFQSRIIQRQINETMGATINQITNKDLATFQIPLPPTKAEQTAIATVLNDADALITALEKLIAKKRAIKQGAMQELLKPKEGWEVRKLGNCLKQNPDYGINAAAVPYNESLPVYLRITDITEDGKYSKKNIVSVNKADSSSFYLEKGDLIFARTGASVGKTYLYNPEDGKLIFAGFLIRIKINSEILNPDFFQYYTQTSFYWNWIRANSMRTGQPGINANEYKKLIIKMPPIEEQIRIAQILSDMDAEIEALEKKLEKYRMIKQGMMQNLLTGKIRLI